MGRKGLFAEKPKKGPGRKAKKQKPPQLTRQFKGICILNKITHWKDSKDYNK